MLERLYEEDYSKWTDETVQILRRREFDKLDIGHLIEEIESLGRDYYKDCFSYAVLIIVHRLYIDYWEGHREQNQFHWQGEIDNWQTLIQNNLTTNIKSRLESEWDIKKTGITRLPDRCPYTLDECLK